jgi:hypothetical protein
LAAEVGRELVRPHGDGQLSPVVALTGRNIQGSAEGLFRRRRQLLEQQSQNIFITGRKFFRKKNVVVSVLL